VDSLDQLGIHQGATEEVTDAPPGFLRTGQQSAIEVGGQNQSGGVWSDYLWVLADSIQLAFP
jgi:hypothetical protein